MSRSLVYHRRQSLLTQRDLAKLTGLSPSTIYSIETGRWRLRISTIRKVVQALGVDWQEVEEFRQVLDEEDHGE